jgi:Tol biopolymer transport system component
MRIKPPEGIGMISGRIIDKKDNKPLPSVLVKVIQDIPFKIAGMSFTSIDGEYVVDNLPDGKYIISTQVEGYMPQCIGDIVIDSNVRSINIDISMPKIEKGYRIAFCRFDNNGSYNVYIMNSDGTNIKQLTYNQQWDTAASISPDGSKIVFIRGDNIWNCGDMWVIDLENDNYEQLVLSGNISFPSFSYDSQQIVFCSNGNLCIINTDGSNYQKVLDMDEPILYPCFSPDNTQIVFVMNNDIYITSVDGSKVQKLTHGSEIDYAPSFAPDASMIIFTREHHISGNTDIWVMYRDGTNQMKIIDNGLFGRISPDDKQIVFVSTVEGNHDIYITDLEDRNSWQQLTSYTDVDTQPTWGCIARAPVVYVWPGDTDNNGIVNAQDIFPIAIYWGKSGYVRNMSVIWEPQAAVLWEIPEATYADANGDGIINAIDILPVGINWGMQHSVITKGTYAPILHCNDNINHKEYTEIYKMMYKILDDMDETYGIAQVKQILQHLIDEEDNMQKYAVVDTSLMQNYPNPFNPECWIPYTLKEEAHVIIRIYNISGQLVRILDEGIKPQGKYITKDEAVYWDGKNNEGNELASGVYIYQLQANGKIIGSKRMVMLK